MKKCIYAMVMFTLLLPALIYAQTDTVDVPDFFDPTGGEGSLNNAVSAKITDGTLSNTVFRLKLYGLYVLSSTITVPAGKTLYLVAPDPGTSQTTAPPMICWTSSSGINTTYNFDCFGDVYMKNIWLLYATTQTDGIGTQVGSALEIDQDTTDNLNRGTFQNVIFDYAPISNSGGSVTVSAAHARLSFENCYFRNNTDTHFRYYGRAVSYPYNTSGWHIDSVSFVNTTFANIGYVFMQEGAEYADYVKFNHCTFLNTVMYTFESGWWHYLTVTNSIFVNAYMFGYIPASDGTTPVGGTVNIDTIGTTNFNFTVPFTESQRHVLFANNSYGFDTWLKNYMAPYDATTNPTGGNTYSNRVYALYPDSVPRPQPIMSAKTMAFFQNKTTWPYISMANIHDSTNPGFLIPPTNQVGIQSFLLRKWTDNSDTTWAFDPHSDVNQIWPVNEQMRYSNSTLKTAAMGGYPLGDLYRWWNNIPATYSGWKAQQGAEDTQIQSYLDNGITGVPTQSTSPASFALSQNYPNPFNPVTTIEFSLAKAGAASLKVYDILGREIATLVDGVQTAGQHSVTFNATNLASGVYFYTLQAGANSLTKKLLLMK
ncbi:MAG TPA: T9SS type A sorting domain-containing protein [Bacteroidota bacterium]|nr:T9SS type A sorting domain-containing protein [Bacteroidota bacterium]